MINMHNENVAVAPPQIGLFDATTSFHLARAERVDSFCAGREAGGHHMATFDGADENLRNLTLQSFTGSALFRRTFDEGMSLVEETARYLDGPGREEQRHLPRKTAMLYAGESMRVTTRLMQAASWLLVQRAVHEGDMDAEDASNERYRLGSKEICFGAGAEGVESLPVMLQDLLERSENLYRRIARLDEVLFGHLSLPAGARGNMAKLEQAFGAK
jgi:regulator of CtrA degradation